MKILVTGGSGFIGRGFIEHILETTDWKIQNLDKLTYAGNEEMLGNLGKTQRYDFQKQDICDPKGVEKCIDEFSPDVILHLAAESHVDRSIQGPENFIQTNVHGTYYLLEAALDYWNSLEGEKKENFKFINISTDEVYGPIDHGSHSEDACYQPTNPYSASKASADHFARTWRKTYDLPVIITHCTNNYGPSQHSEKLIPMTIKKFLNGEEVPLYGDGKQIRDWIFVDDHCRALKKVAAKGEPGQTFNIGANNRMMNLKLVKLIYEILDQKSLVNDQPSCERLITFVEDRPGHDRRYALDTNRIRETLNWEPRVKMEEGLRRTIEWYLDELS